MKNLFITAILLFSMSLSAQKIYDLDKKKDSTSKSSNIKTSDIAIYNGKKLPVYKSKNNKLFIVVTSKSGKEYKKYL